MVNLIAPLHRIGRGPHHHDRLNNRTERRELGDKKHAGARLPLLKPPPEVLQHRLAVMSDQDATLAGCNFKDIGIRNPCEFTVHGGSEVDCRLAPPDRNHDSAMDAGRQLGTGSRPRLTHLGAGALQLFP